MSVSTSIPIEGVLNCWNDEHDLPDLLLSLSRSGRTGRLLFSNPEADKTLFIKEGKIVFAESSSEDDGLGQHLLRTGQISLMDYVRVSRRVEPGKRLGALLVDDGVLEPKELVPGVMGQVRAIILGLFRRTETWYRFKDEDLPRKEAITLDLPVAQLILDGVQYVESWRRVSKGVGSLDSVYRRLAASASEWGHLELTDGVSELLDMLKQPVSVDHVCTHASLPDFDACRYLWAFRCLGWIEPVEVADPVAVNSATPLDPARVATVPSVATVPEVVKPKVAVVPEGRPAEAPAIAQHLIKTRVAIAPPEPAPRSAPPAPPPPPPRPNIEALARTQLAAAAPSPGKKPAETHTAPEVEPPAPPRKPIPEELVHTQLFESPAHYDREEPAPPSAGEMMEAILEGSEPSAAAPSKPRPVASAATTQYFEGASAIEPPSWEPEEPSAPEPPKRGPAASAATTQLFGGASAIEPPKEEDYPPLVADDELPYGFEALALEDAAPPPPSAAITAPSLPAAPVRELPEEGALASFDDLAYAPPPRESEGTQLEAEADVPIVEASVVEVVDGEDPGLAVIEPEAVVEGSPPGPEGGMEALAGSDPFSSNDGFSFDAVEFESKDPVESPKAPKRKSEPRPPAEDMDLDVDGLGHLFGSD